MLSSTPRHLTQKDLLRQTKYSPGLTTCLLLVELIAQMEEVAPFIFLQHFRLVISIYTLGDLVVSSNLIGSLVLD